MAKLLKSVVDAEQPQLVILGKQAIDTDNNQTGQLLAALTGWGQGTFGSKANVQDGTVNVTRESDGGLQTVALKLPAVVTTDLRYAIFQVADYGLVGDLFQILPELEQKL